MRLLQGSGRTGTLFAVQQADVVPDLICLGKSLTGGMVGMAATVAADHVYAPFHSEDPQHALMHGPTFMANPIACAAANASLDLFETEPRLQQARQLEIWMDSVLSQCHGWDNVVDVRCKGAVGVIQVGRLHNRERLIADCVEAGIWVRPFANMVYLTPALTMDQGTVEQLCETLVRTIHRWNHSQ